MSVGIIRTRLNILREPRYWRKAVVALMAGCFIAVIVPLSSVSAPAEIAQDHELKLEQVRKRLQVLQDSVRKDEARASAENKRLRETEDAIKVLTRQLADLDHKLESQSLSLKELRSRYDSERKRMGRFQNTLKLHVRSAYAMGRQGQLKLLLSQEDPATVSRVLTYFRILSDARAKGIQIAADQLKVMEELKYEIVQQTRTLENLRARRVQESYNLERSRAARVSALAELNAEIQRKGRELEQLKKDELRLQQLIDELNEALAAAPLERDDNLSFEMRKGQLRWPVSGQLVTRYGQARRVGDLKWRGVLIGAPEGSDVHAVSQGRVVFADWLRGFGLLLIMDHGEGYMSLYGNNLLLHKVVGDWVSKGELISSVGVSGGQQAPGLYFELRHRGKPVNPMVWFKGLPNEMQVAR